MDIRLFGSCGIGLCCRFVAVVPVMVRGSLRGWIAALTWQEAQARKLAWSQVVILAEAWGCGTAVIATDDSRMVVPVLVLYIRSYSAVSKSQYGCLGRA